MTQGDYIFFGLVFLLFLGCCIWGYLSVDGENYGKDD